MNVVNRIDQFLINESLHLNKGELVKIKGHFNFKNDDLYKVYPWFKKEFPDKDNITGRVYSYDRKTDIYTINFETLNKTKFGQGNMFKGSQVEIL
jgi:hypothetical protein